MISQANGNGVLVSNPSSFNVLSTKGSPSLNSEDINLDEGMINMNFFPGIFIGIEEDKDILEFSDEPLKPPPPYDVEVGRIVENDDDDNGDDNDSDDNNEELFWIVNTVPGIIVDAYDYEPDSISARTPYENDSMYEARIMLLMDVTHNDMDMLENQINLFLAEMN